MTTATASDMNTNEPLDFQSRVVQFGGWLEKRDSGKSSPAKSAVEVQVEDSRRSSHRFPNFGITAVEGSATYGCCGQIVITLSAQFAVKPQPHQYQMHRSATGRFLKTMAEACASRTHHWHRRYQSPVLKTGRVTGPPSLPHAARGFRHCK